MQSFADLSNTIIPHFKEYPLKSQKGKDFLLFKQALDLIHPKTLSTNEGLQDIINIKASMNKNLSEKLVLAFPNTIPVSRSDINLGISNLPALDANWLVGFVEGEGCFHVAKKKSKSLTGFQIQLMFSISQHSRDEVLLNKISKHLDCGNVRIINTRKDHAELRVYKFNDIKEKFIPFFEKYILKGDKLQNYLDFSNIARLIEKKSHLTVEGLKDIQKIRSNMNRSRVLKF